MIMTDFRNKRVGDEFTTTDYNKIVRELKRPITAVHGSGIIVNDTPSGITLSLSSSAITFSPVPVKCTAEDTPSAGLHTFKECDLDGAILTGADEVIYTECRLLGDFDSDWAVSVVADSESFGYLHKYKGANVVVLLPYPGNAYYFE